MTAVSCSLTGRTTCCDSTSSCWQLGRESKGIFGWTLASQPSLGCATADLWETAAKRKCSSKAFKYQA